MSMDPIARGLAAKARRSRNPNLFARLGDSRTEIQWRDPSTKRQLSTSDPFNWANALSGQRMLCPPAYNFAVGGHTTEDQLAYLSSALASGAGNLMIWLGVNDFEDSVTDAVAFTNVRTMMEAALNVGMRPWVFTEPGKEAHTSTRIGYRNDFNQRLREYAEGNANVVLFDIADAVLDHDATSAVAFNSGYSTDGVHLITPGAYHAGVALGQLVRALVPPLSYLPADAQAVRGNGTSPRLDNPMFTTGSGGTAGTGNSGTVPGSFSGSRLGSASCAFSVSSDANGYGNQVEMAVTFSASGENVRLTQSLNTTGLSGGDILQGGVEVDIADSPTNLQCVAVQLDVTVGGATQNFAMLGSTTQGNIPAGVTGLQIKTDTLTIPAGTVTAATWNVRIYGNGAGSATVTVRRPWVRKRFA